MLQISINNDVTTEIEELAESWYKKYEISKGVRCDYKKFHILAEENGEIIGILIGYTAFSEIYIDDLVVAEKFRRRGIGRNLLKFCEEHFENQNFTNINLVTNEFQAPEFYKKCGFTLEFIRKNEKFPLFSKYFFIKWLK